MAELALDVLGQILVRLDVEDLIRCKSVSKPWLSFISSPPFVKAHLDHAYTNDHRNNREFGHRRICLFAVHYEDSRFYSDCMHIVGSCNGLVCVSPIGVKFVVTNPSTREHKKLPSPSYQPQLPEIETIRQVVCWGFGYDSCADDYKVIAGFRKNLDSKRTHFHVLTLKSNTWRVIGQVKYSTYVGNSGILCGGALHWFMTDKSDKKAIISLDLSTEEFKEIPLPDLLYDCDCFEHRLGIIEECLCIYSSFSTLSTKKWVMKNKKWEPYIDDHCRRKYDIVHYLPMNSSYCVDDGNRVPVNGAYIRSDIFVKSLVSPHPQLVCHDNNNHYI